MSEDPYILFESSAGQEIDESLARRLIDSQFPQWSHLPIRAFELDGWDNRSFRLGSELTVRLPSGNWYARQVDKEQRWLPVLAPELPLPIPTPVAKGEPDAEFPYPWSVYRWIDGEPASTARIGDLSDFAMSLARFLKALGRVDATAGPAPGQHNFFRGGPPATYEDETIRAIETLGDEIPPRPSSGCGPTPWPPPGSASPCGSTATSPPGICWSVMDDWLPCSTSARPASAIPPATS